MDEIKKILNELGRVAYIAKRDRLASISADDKKKFIQENGWTHFEDSLMEVDITFYRNEARTVAGLLLDNAYEMEFQRHQQIKRKEALEKGTAVINCNKCGTNCQKVYKDKEGKEHSGGYYGLIDASVSTGFESTDLSDGFSYTFSLCEHCLLTLFSDFKNKPDIYCYM